jgi:hypothetical protein
MSVKTIKKILPKIIFSAIGLLVLFALIPAKNADAMTFVSGRSPNPGSANIRSTGIYVLGNYAYVADFFHNFKIFDTLNPATVYTYTTPGRPQDIFVKTAPSGRIYAYLADSSGLVTIDVTNPAAMPPANIIPLSQASGVFASNISGTNYIFIVSVGNGLGIYNISVNPGAPLLVKNLSLKKDMAGFSGYNDPNDVYIVNNFAYIANGQFGLATVDISNPNFPVQTDVDLFLGDQALGIYGSGNYIYVTARDNEVKIFDTSANPANPVLVGSFPTLGSALDLFADGGYLFVANDDGGLLMLDISADPANPLLVDIYRHASNFYAENVYVSGGYAYVVGTDTYNAPIPPPIIVYGLTILDLSTHPNACYIYPTPKSMIVGNISNLKWWTTPNATFAQIDDGTSNTPASVPIGNTDVSPLLTTTYTMTVDFSSGPQATCTTKLTINPTPLIISASPSTITKNVPTSVQFTVTNSTTGNPVANATVTLSAGGGPCATNAAGQCSITITAAADVTATASAIGYINASTVITVIALPTCTISSSAPNVAASSAFSLTSSTVDALTAIINPGIGAVSIGAGVVTPVTAPATTGVVNYFMNLTGTAGNVNNACNVNVTICAANYGGACISPSNVCGDTTPGTFLCDGTCSVTVPPANPVTTCSSLANSCGDSNSGLRCPSGSCVDALGVPVVDPPPPPECRPTNDCGDFNIGSQCTAGCLDASGNPVLAPDLLPGVGDSCTSPPNSCGATNTGVKKCDLSCDAVPPPIITGGLVPCGRLCDDPDTTEIDERKPCDLCSSLYMLKKVLNFAIEIGTGIAVFIIIIGGLLYAFSAGSTRYAEMAKSAISFAIAGLSLIFAAWVIAAIILQVMGYGDMANWNQVNCMLQT